MTPREPRLWINGEIFTERLVMTGPQLPAGIPLPPGMERFPDLGPAVVGTRPRLTWVVLAWVSAALMAGVGALLLSFTRSPRGDPVSSYVGGFAFLVVAALVAWFATTLSKPILIVDDEAVRTLALIGKASIARRSITKLTMGQLGRSVIVDAEGGITTGGKLSKKKWITISGTHTYRVGTGDLINYIAARTRAAHG